MDAMFGGNNLSFGGSVNELKWVGFFEEKK